MNNPSIKALETDWRNKKQISQYNTTGLVLCQIIARTHLVKSEGWSRVTLNLHGYIASLVCRQKMVTQLINPSKTGPRLCWYGARLLSARGGRVAYPRVCRHLHVSVCSSPYLAQLGHHKFLCFKASIVAADLKVGNTVALVQLGQLYTVESLNHHNNQPVGFVAHLQRQSSFPERPRWREVQVHQLPWAASRACWWGLPDQLRWGGACQCWDGVAAEGNQVKR